MKNRNFKVGFFYVSNIDFIVDSRCAIAKTVIKDWY